MSVSRLDHQDIRIGTLAGLGQGAAYLRQILPHGFESFELTCWEVIGDVDLAKTASEVKEVIAGRAIISSVGVYGNPLTNAQTAEDWATLIKSAHLFDCNVVCGFAGAVSELSVEANIPRFVEVWAPLAKLAEDHGVKIAFENCDMGGTWEHPSWNIAHAPRAWEMMFNAVPSDSLGLEWEPCHQLNSLVDPLPQLKKWIGKVFHVHGKDATVQRDVIAENGTRSGLPYVYHRTPGFGDTNWTDIISILRWNNFVGAIDIEGWHDPVYRDDLEMTGQVFGLNYLKSCRGGAFVANPI